MRAIIQCGMLVCGTLMALFIPGLHEVRGADEKSARELEVARASNKQEVRVSMIGYRDTLIFFTFKDQKSILKLNIGNKDKTFPMKGTVYFFPANTTEEGLKKWLNNQHSDALFPDVPEPISKHEISGNYCKVTSHKFIDSGKLGLGEFDNYDVTFEVKDFSNKEGVKLKGFTGKTKVHIPTMAK